VTAALPAPALLFITDRLSASADLHAVVASALRAGCRWVMLREQDLDGAALAALAAEIVALARPYEACVLVNGDIAAARAAGAGGVHLQAAGEIGRARAALSQGALVGVSAHNAAEADGAIAAGADYVTLSPVFSTASKPGYGPALGTDGLAAACASVAGPVVALAGISPANAARCFAAGAAGIAVMGGIMRAPDPEAATRALLGAIPGRERG
jgi:thiamine-phosphate pyrophosphorylase